MQDERDHPKREQILGMDLDSKIKMMESVTDQILDLQV